MTSLLSRHSIAGIGLATTLLANGLLASTALAAPLVTTFASGAALGVTSPDSVTTGGGSVWVEYSNGASGRGNDGLSSTIVRYGLDGSVQHTFSLSGNVDGLKYDPATNEVYATHNQDANSSLSIINAATNAVGPQIPYEVPASTTRGHDDIAFLNGTTYATHPNPAAGSTNDIVQSLNVTTNPITATTVVQQGVAATNLATGATANLGNVDVDSLKSASGNRLIISDGNGARVIFATNPGSASQSLSFLQLNDASGTPLTSIDDANFVTATSGTFLLADSANNRIVSIYDPALTAGDLYVSPDATTYFGLVDQATGNVTPYITGVRAAGFDFLAGQQVIGTVPEPASLVLLASGVLGLLGLRRRA